MANMVHKKRSIHESLWRALISLIFAEDKTKTAYFRPVIALINATVCANKGVIFGRVYLIFGMPTHVGNSFTDDDVIRTEQVQRLKATGRLLVTSRLDLQDWLLTNVRSDATLWTLARVTIVPTLEENWREEAIRELDLDALYVFRIRQELQLCDTHIWNDRWVNITRLRPTKFKVICVLFDVHNGQFVELWPLECDWAIDCRHILR